MIIRCISMLLLLLATASAEGQALALPGPPQIDYEQHLQARLPLDLRFADDSGRRVRLGEFFDGVPVVLVFGYHHCPNLCSTLMEGILPAFAAVGLPAGSYRLLGVSIDPGEGPELAARKKASYQPMLGRRGGDLHLLTGDASAIAQLAASAGFHYAYDAALGQYAHPAGFLIATPDGRISRYFLGVRFDPQALRLALVEASSGRIGSSADRLRLLCAHYDPATGRYSASVMAALRLLCLTLLSALAGWLWMLYAQNRSRL